VVDAPLALFCRAIGARDVGAAVRLVTPELGPGGSPEAGAQQGEIIHLPAN
jgi:hypothetical protein